ncbi:MsnO8 family LLM class oxidoreductase [Georgenia yuyongxinii]|uniref:MsnO8 family LLM class oxidoreductase n=1 Tax=Georgenia yuyongxinii TaxID=2589797 RepID=A0A5B8C3U2_9MICO|nr:MsnO8 family LLM class oxidoreductase [Georgenia yuyongxinii]QDC24740.1 MsnO8 family LLM class oxidoreductase [Georgenia yuyongxinii]
MTALDVPFSLLDRSRTRAGEADAVAVRATVERARRAEGLGYSRFWVAEHHAVPGIGSGSPAVLAAAVAARTHRIRVGSGGVMLPNHVPLVVAEQFAVLESLYPGRIDLGLGRSLGFSAPVREALRTARTDPEEFLRDVAEVRAYLQGRGPVTARPAVAQAPPMFVLASGAGLTLAARAGLPVVVGGPVLLGPAPLAPYRAAFDDGAAATPARPYVIVSANVMVAATRAAAEELLLPDGWAMAASRATGAYPPLEEAAAVRRRSLTPKQRESVEQFYDQAIYGSPDEVAAELADLVRRAGADEVMLTTSTYDRNELARADAAIARLFTA